MGVDMSFAVEHKGKLVMYLHRVWRGLWLDDAIKIAGQQIDVEGIEWSTREHIDDNGSGRTDSPYWIRTMTPDAFSTFLDQCGWKKMKVGGDELSDDEYEEVVVSPLLHAIDAFMRALRETGGPDFGEVRLVIWYGS